MVVCYTPLKYENKPVWMNQNGLKRIRGGGFRKTCQNKKI